MCCKGACGAQCRRPVGVLDSVERVYAIRNGGWLPSGKVCSLHLAELLCTAAQAPSLQLDYVHTCCQPPHTVATGFKGFASSLEVHMVEVSPALRALQWASLRCSTSPGGPAGSAGNNSSSGSSGSGSSAGSAGPYSSPEAGVSGWNGAKVGAGLHGLFYFWLRVMLLAGWLAMQWKG